MDRKLRNTKIKRDIQLLGEYCYKEYFPIEELSGEIWNDSQKDWDGSETLRIKENSLLTGARKNFHIRGDFQAEKKEGYTALLFLELGNSRSLEALAFLYGPEAIVSIDGKAAAGIDPNHPYVFLLEEYLDGKPHEICLEGWTGIKEERYETGRVGVCYRNDRIYRLYVLSRVCLEIAEKTENELIFRQLENCLQKLDFYEPLGENFEKTAEEAMEGLKKELDKVQEYHPYTVAACGHGHLDLAWLWRTNQARKKGKRTFLNVLGLLERHREFRYSQTQAQLYQWMEKDLELFPKVQKAVKEGRWEILGGMWVEPDCNLPSGESLARQFLLFSSYMQKMFKTKGSPVVWLPDTFGFCGQLPQLMKEAGYQYFATAKLSWNQYNKMPSEYFQWEGIDGNRVLAYIVSTAKPGWWGGTYSADLTPEEVLDTFETQEEKGLCQELLLAYGMGDGGGGPTEEMVVRGELMEQFDFPGIPKVQFSTFQEFFQKMEEKREELPVWCGELYFELHRGTYTSQAETKKNNRLCEVALHQAEFLAAFASEESEYCYPSKEFQKMWEKLCLNQFHDILPGSSIGEVYKDARRDHVEILEGCDEITSQAVKALAQNASKEAQALIINGTSFWQTGIVELPFPVGEGQQIRVGQKLCESYQQHGRTFIKVEKIPPYGYQAVSIEAKRNPSSAQTQEIYAEKGADNRIILGNEKLQIEIDKNGDVIRLWDKEKDREILTSGKKFFQWQLFEDRPADWDAWDLDEDYRKKGFRQANLESAEIFRINGLQAGCYMRKKIGRSTIVQKISIETGAKDIRLDTRLEYRENRQHLRLACPVEIHGTAAEYGTQFGSVTRSIHSNTSWEKAKFETCMHKWADLSEGDYGVSILCDNKYGISIHEKEISLAVSKSADFPDPNADRGTQEFTVVICPHEVLDKGELLRKAYLLSNPLEVYEIEGKGKQIEKSLCSVKSGNVIIETVKQAEDGKGTILRAYEYGNTRGKAEFVYHKKIDQVIRCNLLEEEKFQAARDENRFWLSCRPYEIITVEVRGGK